MVPALSPQELVAKWRRVELKERSASQSHFSDLCRLVGHPTPVEDDPTGERFTQEAAAEFAHLADLLRAWSVYWDDNNCTHADSPVYLEVWSGVCSEKLRWKI